MRSQRNRTHHDTQRHTRVAVGAKARVALVTGSSRGLGSTIARRLARDGLAVAVNGLHGDEDASLVASEIRNEGGIGQAFMADVTDEAHVAELVRAIAAALGPIDVLVLNATGPQPGVPLADVDWHDHLAQLRSSSRAQSFSCAPSSQPCAPADSAASFTSIRRWSICPRRGDPHT